MEVLEVMEQRLVLGASQLGDSCLRRLWFFSRGFREEISEELQRVFDIGRALEPVVVEWLRRQGYEVYYNQKFHEDEPDFSIPVGKGFVEGRFDAVLVDRGMLVDIKTCGDRLFVDLMEGKVPYEYLVQVNVYFFGVKGWGKVEEKLRGCIMNIGIVGAHKSSGKMVLVELIPDLGVFEEAVRKADMVFSVDSYRDLEKVVGMWKCKDCGFAVYCFERL